MLVCPENVLSQAAPKTVRVTEPPLPQRILGKAWDVFEKTGLYRLNLSRDDFDPPSPKRVRLLFAHKDAYFKNTALAGDISPAYLVLCSMPSSPFSVSGVTSPAKEQLGILSVHGFLLLPLYRKKSGGLAAYGVTAGVRGITEGCASGRLATDALRVLGIGLFGCTTYLDKKNFLSVSNCIRRGSMLDMEIARYQENRNKELFCYATAAPTIPSDGLAAAD